MWGLRVSQRRETRALTGIAKPPYVFYATLPNEGILMVEALERRPWWKKGEKVRASIPKPPTSRVFHRTPFGRAGGEHHAGYSVRAPIRWGPTSGATSTATTPCLAGGVAPCTARDTVSDCSGYLLPREASSKRHPALAQALCTHCTDLPDAHKRSRSQGFILRDLVGHAVDVLAIPTPTSTTRRSLP